MANPQVRPAVDSDSAIQNTEIEGLDPTISHILKKCGCQSRTTVREELSELEIDLLLESRNLLFHQARGFYEERLIQSGVEDIMKIEPKNRRVKDTASTDIIDLYLFVMGFREDFPRTCVKDLKMYKQMPITIDDEDGADEEHIDTDAAAKEEGEGDETQTEESNASDEVESVRSNDTSIQIEDDDNPLNAEHDERRNGHLDEEVDQVTAENGIENGISASRDGTGARNDSPDESDPCKRKDCQRTQDEIKRLWEYLLSVEKVSNDRLSAYEAKINAHMQKCKDYDKDSCQKNSSRKPDDKATQSPATAKMHEYRNTHDASTSNHQKGAGKRNVSFFPLTKSEAETKKSTGSSNRNMTSNEQKQTDENEAEPEQEVQSDGQSIDHTGEAPYKKPADHTGDTPFEKPADHTGDTPTEESVSDTAGTDNEEERSHRSDSKHYQVGGDKKFPNKNRKRGLQAANKDQQQNRGAGRVLQAAKLVNHKSRTVELYLTNISKHPSDSLKDIAEMVRECARSGGVYVIASRVIQNRFRDDIVGCKITVPEQQQDDVLGSGSRIWPEGMTCRRWSGEKPNKPTAQHSNKQQGKRKKSTARAYYSRSWSRDKGYWVEKDYNNRKPENSEWEDEDQSRYYQCEEDQRYDEYEYDGSWEDRYDDQGNELSSDRI